jgi:hypothetical protein
VPRPLAVFALLIALAGATGAAAQDASPTAAPAQEPAKKPSLFPLMQDLIKDRPEVPPPYGAALIANWLDSDWRFLSATVGIDDVNVPVEAATNCSANIRVTTTGPKLDLWVLPFLNVFGSAGIVSADNQLILRGVPVGFRPPGVGQPAEVVRGDVVVDFDLDGEFYTAGIVLAGGYKKFFASTDFTASNTEFGHGDQVEADQSHTYSAAVRAGYVVGYSQVWAGGRYINNSSHYRGSSQIPTGHLFSFDVELETATWNMSAGMRTVLQKHWEVLLETGFGDRHMITGSVGYRW